MSDIVKMSDGDLRKLSIQVMHEMKNRKLTNYELHKGMLSEKYWVTVGEKIYNHFDTLVPDRKIKDNPVWKVEKCFFNICDCVLGNYSLKDKWVVDKKTGERVTTEAMICLHGSAIKTDVNMYEEMYMDLVNVATKWWNKQQLKERIDLND